MAHVGQEIALGPVGLLGGFLRQPQFVFAAAQFGGGAFQFGVGNGEFACAGLGGGGAFGHALLQRLIQALQFGKSFGVLQGRAGDRGDELGQAFLVLAEQAADVAMVDVEAAGGFAAHEHRRTQRRTNAGEQGPFLFGLAFSVKTMTWPRGESAVGHVAAVFRFDLSGDHGEVFGGIVALKLEQQATLAAQAAGRPPRALP